MVHTGFVKDDIPTYCIHHGLTYDNSQGVEQPFGMTAIYAVNYLDGTT